MLIKCPHCKSLARIRTSKELSDLTREVTCQCDNVHCGHTFVAHIEAVRTLSPSATPDPLIDLQLTQRKRPVGMSADSEIKTKAA